MKDALRAARDQLKTYLEVQKTKKSGMNIALITLDSLRYDAAQQADTPNFRSVFADYGVDRWHKVYAPGTYTLPSHISMFQAGILPSTMDEEEPGGYNRYKSTLFRPILKWNRNRPAVYPTPEAPNVVQGFKKLDYRTIGIGGVHWFNTKFATSSLWSDSYFSEFFWKEEFHEESFDSFERQIDLTERLLSEKDDRPLFYFLNVSSTHTPYRRSDGLRSVEVQAEALQYVDSHLPRLLDILPRPCHVVVVADHGDCFGEDDLWGHGFYHPKVMEVPMAHFLLEA